MYFLFESNMQGLFYAKINIGIGNGTLGLYGLNNSLTRTSFIGSF